MCPTDFAALELQLQDEVDSGPYRRPHRGGKGVVPGDQHVVPDPDRDVSAEVAVAVGVLDGAGAKLDRPGSVSALLAPTPVECVPRRVDQAGRGERHRAFHMVPRVGVPAFRPWDRAGWLLHRDNRFRGLLTL